MYLAKFFVKLLQNLLYILGEEIMFKLISCLIVDLVVFFFVFLCD
jgi:hypothetical protein